MTLDSINEIVDNNPNAVWNSDKTNLVLNKLDDDIATGLESQNLSINGTQTIYGQKTFSNMYITDTTSLSYDRMMSYLQNDISPVTNNGGKGISTNIVKELSFSKDNVSGVISSIAQKAPVYRNADIYIGWGVPDSISSTISNIEYSCNNIPIKRINNPFPASTSSYVNLLNEIETSGEIFTSVSASGTVTVNSTSSFQFTRGLNLAVYTTDTFETGVMLYKTPSASITSGQLPTIGGIVYLSSTSGNIVGFRRMGFCLSTSSSFVPLGAVKQITLNNTLNFSLERIVPDDLMSIAGFVVKSDVLLEYQCFDLTIDLGNPTFTPSFKSISPLYNFEPLSFGFYRQRTKFIKVPFVYNRVSGNFIVNRDAFANTWNNESYMIQNSARVSKITYFN
jgi:hypothetical protein